MKALNFNLVGQSIYFFVIQALNLVKKNVLMDQNIIIILEAQSCNTKSCNSSLKFLEENGPYGVIEN